jgi:hypothetical protein
VFIQYLYKEEIIKDFVVVGWYEETMGKEPGSVMLKKVNNGLFVVLGLYRLPQTAGRRR